MTIIPPIMPLILNGGEPEPDATTTTPDATTTTPGDTALAGADGTAPDTVAEGVAEATAGETALAGEAGDDMRVLAGERAGEKLDTYEDTQYEKTSDDPVAATGESFTTPSTTVAGQLSDILSKGSQLSQVAQSRAREQASALGMMSSSAGIGATQRALIDSAMPIAEQDAKTAAEFKRAEQDIVSKQTEINTEAQVSGDLLIHKTKIFDKQKQTQDKWDMLAKAADADANERTAYVQEGINTRSAEMQNELALLLSQLPLDANAEADMGNTIAEAGHDISSQFATLMGDNDFLDNMVIKKADGTIDKAASDAAYDAAMNAVITPWKNTLILRAKTLGIYTPEFQTEMDTWASNTYIERGVQR